ncbi:hypothetical protein EVAR_95964_1 [Eumeta japonica]|uniref:Uncharacterized protein n=1 Tax=Eumeta variegata TaxID=151549 RepID=A0A4C1V834_EUMVA|nr:hypothetical protein EVAR_95964_1 [Eumeta japonica]
MDTRNPKDITSGMEGDRVGWKEEKRKWTTRTLTHCTKDNSESYYFTAVFSESVAFYRSSRPCVWPTCAAVGVRDGKTDPRVTDRLHVTVWRMHASTNEFPQNKTV